MMNDISTDRGTVLEPGTWAATWSSEKGYILITPNIGDDGIVPNEALTLMAAFLRLDNDPDFRDDCLNWMHEQHRDVHR